MSRLTSRPTDPRLASGTPPVLALSSVDAALEAFDGVVADLRATSLSLTDLFIAQLDEHLGDEFELVTPREHAAAAARCRSATRRRTGSSRR